ncbi:head-tail joining protein [Paracoccus phage vB_PmaS-R3]|uniref:Head-tail joining protein n=1 Tax=Paracoccus phage vB_PmaS-R3 TaxID=2494563 RepID=A0A0B5A7K1_9CAUD|nr:head closure Hc1 [Paracoccus phage vB_PmaS-R3]AJD83166.1 head-tail joining protein [Paracoccus phage vB_PmaS-R3]
MGYERQIATAKRLIAAKGRSCVWSQMGSGTPGDPSKPWKPGEATPDTFPVNIVFLPESQTTLAFLRTLGDTDIAVGEDYGLMPAVDFVPTQRAEIYAADGVTLLRNVLRYNVLAPDGDPILYTVHFGVAE